MAKRSFVGKVGESIINAAVLGPRALLATTTCAGQLLRNFLATDVNGGRSLKYKQSLKNYGKKLTYALSSPVTAWNQKLKQKRGKLETPPGPKERNKDMVRYDYVGRTLARKAKYNLQVSIDAGLLGSEGLESMLYLDKESPMYTGPWPTIKQKFKNLGKSIIMPFEPIFRRSQNKLGIFGGRKKTEKSEKKPEEKKPEEKKPEVKPEEKKIEAGPIETKPVEVKKSNDKAPEAQNPERGSAERMKKMEAEGNDAEVDKYLAERGKPAGAEFGSDKKTIDGVNAKQKAEAEEKKAKEDGDKPKTIDGIKKEQKEESAKKDQEERNKNFPKRSELDDKFKKKYKEEYDAILKKPNREGVIARGKEAKLGTEPEEIVKNLQEKDPTFAGYIEDEILNKKNNERNRGSDERPRDFNKRKRESRAVTV